MQEIAGLREKLGFRQCGQRFAENDIDFAILGDLTDHDLFLKPADEL
jgi:hypothetical protein